MITNRRDAINRRMLQMANVLMTKTANLTPRQREIFRVREGQHHEPRLRPDGARNR